MWFLSLDEVHLGEVQDRSCSERSGACQVIPDTGTSIIVVPQSVFSPFYLAITSKRSDCILPILSIGGPILCTEHSFQDLPDLRFNFGGYEYVLKPQDYVITQGNRFIIGIQTLSLGSSSKQLYILGDSFLRVYPSVFNYQQNGKYGAVLNDSCVRDTASYSSIMLSQVIKDNIMFAGCSMSSYRLSLSCSKTSSTCKASTLSGTKTAIRTSLDEQFSLVVRNATLNASNHCSQLETTFLDDQGLQVTLLVSLSCVSKPGITYWLWIGIAILVVLVVIAVILVMVFTKKKQTKSSSPALLNSESHPSVRAP
jgi:hypothetical protein